jgi:L-seryl-tRNA(Ser) seleniumtransferase
MRLRHAALHEACPPRSRRACAVSDVGENVALRALPSVNKVAESAGFRELANEFGDGIAKLELRAAIDEARTQLREHALTGAPEPAQLLVEVRARLTRLLRPEGRRAINATGILLHTGLGRAPLCQEAAQAIAHLDRYSVLQADISDGSRSERDEKVERLLTELTGAEAATVVNNNAAATMLVLNTLAAGREVIISRGQLIEIGGSFRLPDVMERSGAVLREVGTTNRTHVRDYETAIADATAALMHVHTSNYRVRGFAGTPPVSRLIELGKRRGLIVIDDLGSGALVPLSPFGLPDEPLVRDSIAAGADVACFSGDKLICGPQAGIIVGRRDIIARVRKNPFARMFRVCKMTLAALEATLIHFVNGEAYRRAIPLYQMLARTQDELLAQAQKLVGLIANEQALSTTIADDVGYVGSGAIPDEGVPTKVVRLAHGGLPANVLAARLRATTPAVFGRINDEAVVLDMRTVLPDEIEQLAASIARAAAVQTDPSTALRTGSGAAA